MLLGAVGVFRFPDLYSRLQSATKAATLGVSLMILALAIHFEDFGITVSALLVIAFVCLTAPVAAHVIGRAAYFTGVPLWESPITDELRNAYDAPPEDPAEGPAAPPPEGRNRELPPDPPPPTP
ncbi:MAG: monovalent cation/H(+) antiporter subunit G [Deltaproteobacteria bacterium]|nr:monovalent cation/H(+) antiporter subunit G [Deltaproteobacteria bacterium]